MVEYSTGFWIKFVLLSLIFMVIIWLMGSKSPGLSLLWRVMFTLCAPVGIFVALAGKSLKVVSGRKQ